MGDKVFRYVSDGSRHVPGAKGDLLFLSDLREYVMTDEERREAMYQQYCRDYNRAVAYRDQQGQFPAWMREAWQYPSPEAYADSRI